MDEVIPKELAKQAHDADVNWLGYGLKANGLHGLEKKEAEEASEEARIKFFRKSRALIEYISTGIVK